MAEARRRFRFLKELAQGGFGKVYLAEMLTGENFSSVVAIKILHARWAENAEVVMRSRDEARLLGRLRHRSIVRVESLTRIQHQVAIVMEYLEGADLKAIMGLLREGGRPFPRQAAFEITGAIASALDAAYNQVPLSANEPLRVIHRDIKPSNAMLTVEGDVKVLDFGTARASFEHREAKTQALAFGSAAYMSPERLMGEEDTPAADVFSLGITLYELLTLESFGKIPVRFERFQSAVDEKIDAIDLSALPEPVRAPARETLRQMLAYEAAGRPTAAAVVDLMESLAESCRDGGLKRFARDVVRDVIATEAVEPDPNDAFTGQEFYEDTGTLPEGGTRTDVWSTESGAYDRSDVVPVVTPVAATPPPVAPPAFAAHPNQTIVIDEPVDEVPVLAPPPSPFPPVASPGSLAVAPDAPADAPVHREEDDPATVLARSPFDLPQQNRFASSATIVADDAHEPTLLTAPAFGAPPPPVNTGIAATQVASPTTPSAPPRSKTGLVVGLVFGGLVLAAGGAYVALKPGAPAEVKAPAPVTEAPRELKAGDAAVTTTPNQPGRGAVALRIEGVQVKEVVVSTGEVPTRWDGSGVLNVRDLPPGKVRAQAMPAGGGERLGGTVEVRADVTCAYVLRGGVWAEEECK